MAENRRSPSISPNPENEGSENTPSKNGLESTPSQPSIGREISTPRHDSIDDMIPSIFETDEINTSMKLILVEIPPGFDILQTLINFARQHNSNLTVLSGMGPVSNITLLNPVSHAPHISIQGPSEMISLSGMYVTTNHSFSSFAICLSGVSGQLIGGVIGGKVMATGHVFVTAILFKDFDYEPAADVEEDDESTADVEQDHDQSVADVIINDNHAAVDPKIANT